MIRKKTNRTPVTGRDRLYNIIITVLAVILVLQLAIFGYALRERARTYNEDARSILELISRNDYADAIEAVCNNRIQGIDDSSYTEAYAVTDYYEASLLYHTYTQAGDSAQAARYKNQMDEAYSRMGELKYKAADIEKLFE